MGISGVGGISVATGSLTGSQLLLVVLNRPLSHVYLY